MAYLDAILNSELLSYIVATILITIAVWLFSGLYSCVTCSKKERGDDDVKKMTTKSWFKLLLGIACAACSGLLVYRNVMSAPPPTASPPPIGYVRGGPIAQIGGNDSDSEDSNFN